MPDEPSMRDAETAAVISLAKMNIPPDVQELLVRGDPKQDIKPGALRRALLAGAVELAKGSSPTAARNAVSD